MLFLKNRLVLLSEYWLEVEALNKKLKSPKDGHMCCISSCVFTNWKELPANAFALRALQLFGHDSKGNEQLCLACCQLRLK